MKNKTATNYSSDIKFTNDQQDVFEKIINQLEDILAIDMAWDNILALSGAAGTGKTFLITQLIKYLNDKYNITVTAPTHKALKVIRDNFKENDIDDIELKTIHSFLNIKLFTDYTKGVQSFRPDKTKIDKSKTDILIIDESSMVSNELYEYIEDTIIQERVKAILFVGDYYQLLPVDNSENKIFNIRHQYKLSKIVRQAQDSYIINVASKARNMIKSQKYTELYSFFSQNSDLEIEFFNNEEDFYSDFYKNKYWENEDKIITSFTNNNVDKHNAIIRDKYWSEKGQNNIKPFMVGDKLILQSTLTIKNIPVYYNGDEVIIAHVQKEYFKPLNIWYWKCKDRSQVEFQVIDPSSYTKYNEELNRIAKAAKAAKYPARQELWKIFFDIKDLFIEVKYPYASTIHKLQGSTYKTVYIDLLYMFTNTTLSFNEIYRLIYVAITRASDDIKILMPAINQDKIKIIEDNFNSMIELGLMESLVK